MHRQILGLQVKVPLVEATCNIMVTFHYNVGWFREYVLITVPLSQDKMTNDDTEILRLEF